MRASRHFSERLWSPHARGLLCALFALCTLWGCSSVRESVGLNRTSPDEFAVLTRAPLEIPPQAELPVPRPGAPRPQEQTPAESARAALFGVSSSSESSSSESSSSESSDRSVSAGEAALIGKAAAADVPADIRARVDTESQADAERNVPVVHRLFGTGTARSLSGDVVDPEEEIKRLREEQGLSVLPAPAAGESHDLKPGS